MTGQEGDDRPYEERQRQPGDYEAQVGQRPVAVHALEHLGTTDRGVLMLRRLLGEGMRAVQRGEEPWRPASADGRPIATYAGNSVVRVPPAARPEDEAQLLLATGRGVATRYHGFRALSPSGRGKR